MKTLGQLLKFGREGKGFTLRDVEEAIGVSNAYLSQLENDKIKRPSANVLYKLSTLFGVTMDSLLQAAGIIDKAVVDANGRMLAGIRLEVDEETQLIEYLQWMRSRKRNILHSSALNKKYSTTETKPSPVKSKKK